MNKAQWKRVIAETAQGKTLEEFKAEMPGEDSFEIQRFMDLAKKPVKVDKPTKADKPKIDSEV